MPPPFVSNKPLIDEGFDQAFGWERLESLAKLFTDDDRLQEFIYAMHKTDQSCDLKRGEFYPELLRAVLSLKRVVGTAYDLDPNQVQPNFGSNGSIDTLLSAAKIEEMLREKIWGEERLVDLRRWQTRPPSSRRQQAEKTILSDIAAGRSEGGALFSSPTYFRNYNSAAARQMEIHLVKLRANWTFDTTQFLSEMHRLLPTIIFLVTPNNPTGIPLPDEDICAVLDELPPLTWAVIDRTLVNTREEIDTSQLLKRYREKNVVILHSFSKYQGLSHLRIGVALHANPDLARKVAPFLPLGLGLEACVKGCRLVAEQKGLFPTKQIIQNITENRRHLTAFSRVCPEFSFTDFSGNYALLLLPMRLHSKQITAMLEKEGLHVMGGHEFPEPNPRVVRLHVGGPPEYMKLACRLLGINLASL